MPFVALYNLWTTPKLISLASIFLYFPQ